MVSVRDPAFIKAKERFLPYDNVIGIGIGPKLRKGYLISSKAIVVLVTKKLPPDEVPKNQLIPQFFEGYPVDVHVPKLTIIEHLNEKKGLASEETEYEWIDWGKIHRIHHFLQSIPVEIKEELK